MNGPIDRYLKPDVYCTSLDNLDFALMYRRGYRLVLFDVDNTLAMHGSQQADDYAAQAVVRAQRAGMTCRIVSNASHRRISAYAKSIGLPYAAWAKKPSIRAIRSACRESGIAAEQTIMIGDQILTDVFSARRAGCLAVLVRPRFRHEAFNVRIKRFFERFFFHYFKLSDDQADPNAGSSYKHKDNTTS